MEVDDRYVLVPMTLCINSKGITVGTFSMPGSTETISRQFLFEEAFSAYFLSSAVFHGIHTEQQLLILAFLIRFAYAIRQELRTVTTSKFLRAIVCCTFQRNVQSSLPASISGSKWHLPDRATTIATSCMTHQRVSHYILCNNIKRNRKEIRIKMSPIICTAEATSPRMKNNILRHHRGRRHYLLNPRRDYLCKSSFFSTNHSPLLCSINGRQPSST